MRSLKIVAAGYCIGVILALLAFAASALPVRAQSALSCAPRDYAVPQLIEEYGQRRIIVMMSGDTMIEIFVNRETGAWTAHRLLRNGMACFLDGGDAFELIPVPLPPEGDAL